MWKYQTGSLDSLLLARHQIKIPAHACRKHHELATSIFTIPVFYVKLTTLQQTLTVLAAGSATACSRDWWPRRWAFVNEITSAARFSTSKGFGMDSTGTYSWTYVVFHRSFLAVHESKMKWKKIVQLSTGSVLFICLFVRLEFNISAVESHFYTAPGNLVQAWNQDLVNSGQLEGLKEAERLAPIGSGTWWVIEK